MSMKEIEMEALRTISKIAWEDNPDAEHLLQQIQAVLYELEQIQDARSDRNQIPSDGLVSVDHS